MEVRLRMTWLLGRRASLVRSRGEQPGTFRPSVNLVFNGCNSQECVLGMLVVMRRSR